MSERSKTIKIALIGLMTDPVGMTYRTPVVDEGAALLLITLELI